MRVKGKFDKEAKSYAFECPICGEYTLMTNIDEDEEEILHDGGKIEYWCDNCDEQVQVFIDIDENEDECPCHYENDEENEE